MRNARAVSCRRQSPKHHVEEDEAIDGRAPWGLAPQDDDEEHPVKPEGVRSQPF